MGDSKKQKASENPLVVVWSQDPSLVADGEAELRIVSTRSAYQAAGEVLAGPVVAIVIDLRLLTPRHLRLVKIAREMDIEMLAVGSLPPDMSSDDLSSVRLVSRDGLSDTLKKLCAKAEQPVEPGRKATIRLTPAKSAEVTVTTVITPPAGEKTVEPVPQTEEEFVWDDPGIYAPEPPTTKLLVEEVEEDIPVKSAATDDDHNMDYVSIAEDEHSEETPDAPRAETSPPSAENWSNGLLTPEEIAALLGNET